MKYKILKFQYTALLQSSQVLTLATVFKLPTALSESLPRYYFHNELLQGIQTVYSGYPLKIRR